MSYHIHHTEGFIVGSAPTGDSNKVFFIYTKDLGLLVGIAQGIRELKSKLRFALQDYSLVRLSLVRGKESWRITNAEEINGFKDLSHSKEKFGVLTRISKLIKRFVHGEEKNEKLYTLFVSLLVALEKQSIENLPALEVIALVDILDTLGYLPEEEIFEPLKNGFTEEAVLYTQKYNKDLVLRLNELLRETHL